MLQPDGTTVESRSSAESVRASGVKIGANLFDSLEFIPQEYARDPNCDIVNQALRTDARVALGSAEVKRFLADPRGLARRFAPIEKRSALVKMAGAGDFRELAKDLAFRGDDEVLAYARRSKISSNAYATPALTLRSILQREAKLLQANNSFHSVPTSKRSCMFFVDLPITNLPPELEGFRLYFDSDIHLREKRLGPIREIEATTAFLNDRGIVPDFVGLGGDLTTKRPSDLTPKALRALEAIPFVHGRGTVLGNHDYYGQGRDCVAFDLNKIDYPDLTDGRIRIKIGNAVLNIYGVDDHLEGRPKPPQIGTEQAREINIVLVHNLDAVQKEFSPHIDAFLSGHTHWGEVDFGIFNGSDIMQACGYLDMLNGHARGFEALSDRAISYITPGHGSHFFRYRTSLPGGTMLRLVRAVEPSDQEIERRIHLAV